MVRNILSDGYPGISTIDGIIDGNISYYTPITPDNRILSAGIQFLSPVGYTESNGGGTGDSEISIAHIGLYIERGVLDSN
jgi:hypothetical protein